MSFEITIGWWLIPAILSVVFWIVAGRYDCPTGGYFGNLDIEGLIRYGVAIIGMLAVWLVYALVT